MILSKSLVQTRNTFTCVLRHYKIHTSHIHYLRSPNNLRVNAALGPEINHIVSRAESSQVISKDKILTLPTDVTPTASVSVPVGDGLPAVPTVPASTTDTTVSFDIPEIVAQAAVPLNKLGEPTLQSLGLGCYYTPVGWVQNALEFVHCTFNCPWWASISICVLIARLLMFPLVIKQQRNSIRMHNCMPEMHEIQMRMSNARTFGNDVEAAKAGHELAEFMAKSGLKPGSQMVVPLVQAPIFISFFMGLRAMANTPVESLTRGGMLWFVDLTLQDQYYLLPIITCVTLYISIQVGADFGKMSSANALTRYLPLAMKCIPIICFPFMMHFPTACCVYWASTNMITLVQVSVLKIPHVREYFKIDQKQKIDASRMPGGKKNRFVKDFKSTLGNLRIAKQISERERLDEMAFRRAGRMPPARTFKKNPLESAAHVQK